MQGNDYSLPLWVETDISKFVSGRLHYCNPSLLPPPPGFQPVGFAVRKDDLSKSISISLGITKIQHTFDEWVSRLIDLDELPDFIWPAHMDMGDSHPTDGELTIEFTGKPVSEGVRAFAMQYLQEFQVEEKLTHGDSSIVLNTTGISIRSEDE